MDEIRRQVSDAVCDLLDRAAPETGGLLVVGCSSSAVLGREVGSFSSEEVGQAVFDEIYRETQKRGLFLAAQCCEHLNRCLILEAEVANKFGYPLVNAVPQLKAGGSLALAAYRTFSLPVAVEEIKADCGIDIGGTLIGMHLKQVAVPLALPVKQIGSAVVTYARTRPKFIGGIRAVYDETML